MAVAFDAPDTLAIEYRRRARRLRGVYAAHPARLQHGLRDLARRHDLRRLIAKTLQPPTVLPSATEACDPLDVSALSNTLTEKEHRFAAVVMGQFEGPVLCFSRRQEMLELAERLGIGRFHANFIIATVQHRLNEAEHTLPSQVRSVREKRGLPWSVMLITLLVQSVIAGGLWMVLK